MDNSQGITLKEEKEKYKNIAGLKKLNRKRGENNGMNGIKFNLLYGRLGLKLELSRIFQ